MALFSACQIACQRSWSLTKMTSPWVSCCSTTCKVTIYSSGINSACVVCLFVCLLMRSDANSSFASVSILVCLLRVHHRQPLKPHTVCILHHFKGTDHRETPHSVILWLWKSALFLLCLQVWRALFRLLTLIDENEIQQRISSQNQDCL